MSLDLINEFEHRLVTFISLEENIHMNTPTGKFLILILSGICELELDVIVQRTNEGLTFDIHGRSEYDDLRMVLQDICYYV